MAPHCIHIWQIALDAPWVLPQQKNNYAVLSPDEQVRADRFVFEKHRRRFIAAHAALRKILGDYLQLLPHEIIFETTHYGKPEIAAHQNSNTLMFNLSHSGETALVGLRTEKMIGIDIEYYQDDREFLGIAEHVFSESECAALSVETITETEKIQRFFHIWAQKEAFIKAIGQGLSYPLKEFSVSPELPAALLSDKLLASRGEMLDDWYFHSFKPLRDAQAAIATLKPVEQVSYFCFTSPK